jgi:hypothetical protein
MTLDHYVLDGHVPKAVSWDEWVLWNADGFEARRRVAFDDLGAGVTVSTVFLGLDHQFGSGPPLLFETMIFGGQLDEFQARYSTWDQAIAGHAKAVKRARAAQKTYAIRTPLPDPTKERP